MAKGLTFLDHGYDDAHSGLVLRGPLCPLCRSCLYHHDLDHPYGRDDLSLGLCLSPDFFLYLYQIRESGAAPKTISRSNKQQQQRNESIISIVQLLWDD